MPGAHIDLIGSCSMQLLSRSPSLPLSLSSHEHPIGIKFCQQRNKSSVANLSQRHRIIHSSTANAACQLPVPKVRGGKSINSEQRPITPAPSQYCCHQSAYHIKQLCLLAWIAEQKAKNNNLKAVAFNRFCALFLCSDCSEEHSPEYYWHKANRTVTLLTDI